jgi:uncharacterized protein (DUF2141 family)
LRRARRDRRKPTQEKSMTATTTLAATCAAAVLAAATGQFALARAVEPGTLAVTVNNVREGGNIYVSLFDSADDYAAGEALHLRAVPVIRAGSVTFSFPDLDPGVYAFRLFQDIDGDDELDMRFGVPTEPYGFSNGARGRFGPATFEDAAIEIAPGDNVQAVDLP